VSEVEAYVDVGLMYAIVISLALLAVAALVPGLVLR
jgi:hypothetical protein